MNNDDLIARLKATFAIELQDQVATMNANLLAFEQDSSNGEQLRSLFRAAHTIKGAARVAGIADIENACEIVESIFADVRSDKARLSGSDFAILFALVDELSSAATALQSKKPYDGSALNQLAMRLQKSHAQGATAIPAPVVSAERPETQQTRQESVTGVSGESSIRVSAQRVDTLLNQVTDLTLAIARLEKVVPRDNRDVRNASREIRQGMDRLADEVHAIRLRPFQDAVEGLPRAVRDVAATTGKKVELQLEGTNTEVDRIVIDALREPLLHLVRNAVDHGIESPEARRAAGKKETGTLRIAAQIVRGSLRVTVEDDGAGIDVDAVRTAIEQEGGDAPRDTRSIARALLHGGVSSRQSATAISGRGVGLDLVRSRIEAIGGRVDLTWQAGSATRFTLTMPPRPAALRVIAITASGAHFAIPTESVERLGFVETDDVNVFDNRAMVRTAGGAQAVASIASILGPPLQARPMEQRVPAVVVRSNDETAIILVDDFVAEVDVMLRPIPVAARVPNAMGAALLPDGRVAVVLDPVAIVAAAYELRTAPGIVNKGERRLRRVLVVDDSITTRTLEQGVLEAAGYQVMTAVDGEDAWRVLQHEEIDLIVADVEMPNLDGFGLLERLRSSRRFGEVPVVMVTGRESDADRRRGLDLGANAYLEKSGFDQRSLLNTVEELIGD